MVTTRSLVLLLSLVSSRVSCHCNTNAEFECGDKACVPLSWVCDGSQDCADGSDENDGDGGGELGCHGALATAPGNNTIATRNCTQTEFKCGGGSHGNTTTNSTLNHQHLQCIPTSWLCDGESDCLDDSDESSNICSNFNCSLDQFTCGINSGGKNKCLPLTWVCDGSTDCGGGEDERGCNATCTPSEYTCPSSGRCIASSWVCDGNRDCDGGQDELNCENKAKNCSQQEFSCQSGGHCVSLKWVCDGEVDCGDGSDESNCTAPLKTNCPPSSHPCPDKSCIHSSWVCDGAEDCIGGEDEVGCNVTMATATTLQELVCNNHTHFPCPAAPAPAANSTNSSIICLPLSSLCNQVNDCGGWEDEDKEKCGLNECSVNNGNCKDKCVDLPIGHYCGCHGDGYRMEKGECIDINECQLGGYCSQTCTNEVGGFKCSCLEGYLPDPSNHNRCKAVEGHASLLFSLRNNIRKISLDHLKMTLIVENTKSTHSLDYQFRTGMIYWSDGLEARILKAPIDEGTTTQTPIINCTLHCESIAVDWIYNHIYWIESAGVRKSISVAELDGRMRKEIVREGLYEPRSIVLVPERGLMFWADWNPATPSIHRSSMNGHDRVSIVTTNLKWPNSLTTDLLHSRIYWIDAKLHSIESINYEGRERRTVLKSTIYLQHPFSITTFEDEVYWADWGRETIYRANKINGTELRPVLQEGTVKNVMSVHIYHAYRQPESVNLCLAVRCSHLCLPYNTNLSVSVSCECPDGLEAVVGSTSCGGAGNEKKLVVANNNNNNSTTKLNGAPQRSSNTVLVIVAVLLLILGGTVLATLSVYRHLYTNSSQQILASSSGLNFDNPVYRKTTDGINIIESSTQGGGCHEVDCLDFGFYDPLLQQREQRGEQLLPGDGREREHQQSSRHNHERV